MVTWKGGGYVEGGMEAFSVAQVVKILMFYIFLYGVTLGVILHYK